MKRYYKGSICFFGNIPPERLLPLLSRVDMCFGGNGANSNYVFTLHFSLRLILSSYTSFFLLPIKNSLLQGTYECEEKNQPSGRFTFSAQNTPFLQHARVSASTFPRKSV